MIERIRIGQYLRIEEVVQAERGGGVVRLSCCDGSGHILLLKNCFRFSISSFVIGVGRTVNVSVEDEKSRMEKDSASCQQSLSLFFTHACHSGEDQALDLS